MIPADKNASRNIYTCIYVYFKRQRSVGHIRTAAPGKEEVCVSVLSRCGFMHFLVCTADTEPNCNMSRAGICAEGLCVCVCVCVCVCARALCVCARALCVCVSVCLCLSV